MSRIDALPIGDARAGAAWVRRFAVLWSAPVLAALVGAALLALFALAPPSERAIALDVGAEGLFRAPDETATVRHLAGFHAPETDQNTTFRWTNEWARLVVPDGYRLGERLLLQLRLCGCHPDGAQPVARLSLDNREIAALPTTGAYRRYTLLVPPGRGAAGADLFVELRTPTTVFDGRPVGVRLDRLDLFDLSGAALPWPVPASLALAGALGALVVIRAAGRRASRAVLLGALLLGPAIVLSVYRHQPLAPDALVLAALCGPVLIALVRPARPAVALVLAALALALVLAPQLLGGWLVDDAFISFRYAQQLVAGQGLVFNPGERVEGYTNFLWTLASAGVLWLGGDPARTTRLLTLVIGQAALALCYAVRRRITRSDGPAGLAAPLLLATSGPFLLYSARGSGLETALFTLLLLAGAWAYLARRWAACGALLALAALTRPEGVLVLAITAGHALLSAERCERLRRAGVLIGTFLAIFLPYYAWRFSYYGLPLPNTFYVKVGASWAQVQRGIAYLASYWAAEGWAWGLGLAALVPIGLAIRRSGQGMYNVGPHPRRCGSTSPPSALRLSPAAAGEGEKLLPSPAAAGEGEKLLPSPVATGEGRGVRAFRSTLHMPWLQRARAWAVHPAGYVMSVVLAFLAYVVAVGGDWLPEARFLVPLVPLFALLAQAGLARLAEGGRWGSGLALALLALALFDHTRHTLTTSAYDASTLIWRENEVVARRREVGRWLRDNTPPDTLVAVEAAGALPYYSQRPVIDILGLNDRHIASLEVPTIGQGKPGHEKTDIPYVLGRRPAIIPYFAAPYFLDQPLFRQLYAPEEHDGPEGSTVILYRRIQS